jgi:hypothetical protein
MPESIATSLFMILLQRVQTVFSQLQRWQLKITASDESTSG